MTSAAPSGAAVFVWGLSGVRPGHDPKVKGAPGRVRPSRSAKPPYAGALDLTTPFIGLRGLILGLLFCCRRRRGRSLFLRHFTNGGLKAPDPHGVVWMHQQFVGPDVQQL